MARGPGTAGQSARKAALLALALIASALWASAPAAASSQDVTVVGQTPDGSHVYFQTTERLTTNDLDNSQDVYQSVGGTVTLVSIGVGGAGNGETGASFEGATPDGSSVFVSTAEPLITSAGPDQDTDTATDVYQRNFGAHTFTRVSRGPDGGNANIPAVFRAVSSDGTKVVFETSESLITSGPQADTDATGIDLYQFSGGTTTRLSLGPAGGNGVSGATFGGASADLSRVFFVTTEHLVAADTDPSQDVYQRQGAVTTILSQGPDGGNATDGAGFLGSSTDGTKVFFATVEQLITSGAQADSDAEIDIYQSSGGTTTRVSLGPDGGNGSFAPHFEGSSSDGNVVVWTTSEKLITSGAEADTDDSGDVYERVGGSTTHRISLGPQGGNASTQPAFFRGLSADGSHVFFVTGEPLIAAGAEADTDTSNDIYVRVPASALTERITLGPDGGNGAGFSASQFAGASTDGSTTAFATDEPLITSGPEADRDHTFSDAYQRTGSTTTRLSLGPNGGNGPFDVILANRALSDDGSTMTFSTHEALVAADADTDADVYQRAGGVTTLLSPDDVPPTASIDSGPSGPTNDATPTFGLSSSDPGSVFDCSLDGAAATACAAPFTTGVLLDGPHALAVRARDSYGNLGQLTAARDFTLDTIPPDTSITDGPQGLTGSAAPAFSFATEAGAGVDCRIDAAAFAPCASPFTAAVLSEGAHTFEVRATDAAGNVDATPATRGFTVDTVPPDTSITDGPSGLTGNAAPAFSFATEAGAGVACRIDAAEFAPCGSPFTAPALPDGAHTFEVRATDAAGNVDATPASRAFTVDTAGPIVAITPGTITLDRRRRAVLRIACGSEPVCAGTLVLRTRGRRPKLLGTALFDASGGHVARLSVRLSSAGRRAVAAKRKGLPASATAAAHDALGNIHITTRNVKLKRRAAK